MTVAVELFNAEQRPERREVPSVLQATPDLVTSSTRVIASAILKLQRKHRMSSRAVTDNGEQPTECDAVTLTWWTSAVLEMRRRRTDS